jgi:hypothetical protein
MRWEVDYPKTHYERTLAVAAGTISGDVHADCTRLLLAGREGAIPDVLRRAVQPYARGSFRECIDSPAAEKVVTYVAAVLTALGAEAEAYQGEFSTQLLLAWQLNRFENAGKRAYIVSPALQRRLLATELRGIRCEDLKLPYP